METNLSTEDPQRWRSLLRSTVETLQDEADRFALVAKHVAEDDAEIAHGFEIVAAMIGQLQALIRSRVAEPH